MQTRGRVCDDDNDATRPIGIASSKVKFRGRWRRTGALTTATTRYRRRRRIIWPPPSFNNTAETRANAYARFLAAARQWWPDSFFYYLPQISFHSAPGSPVRGHFRCRLVEILVISIISIYVYLHTGQRQLKVSHVYLEPRYHAVL